MTISFIDRGFYEGFFYRYRLIPRVSNCQNLTFSYVKRRRHSALLPNQGLARRGQEGPGGARRSQEGPGGARRCQEEPGGARRSQEWPGGVAIVSPSIGERICNAEYSKQEIELTINEKNHEE